MPQGATLKSAKQREKSFLGGPISIGYSFGKVVDILQQRYDLEETAQQSEKVDPRWQNIINLNSIC